MRFNLSVAYQDSLFLYAITTEDQKTFQLRLKSAPQGKEAPEEVTVLHPEKDVWIIEQEVEEAFRESVIRVLKRTKL